jgi:nicotinamide riboside transporter PnuC
MTFWINATQIVFETLDTNILARRSFHSLNIMCEDVFLEHMFNIMVIILSQIEYLLFQRINILFFSIWPSQKRKKEKKSKNDSAPNIVFVKLE